MTGPQLILTNDQITTFDRDGFLAIEHVLDDDDIAPVEQEYAALLDGLAARLYQEGRLKETYADLDFGRRYSKVIAEAPETHCLFDISLPLQNGDIDPDRFHMHTGPEAFHLLRHKKILDVVQQLIGPEIYASPVQHMRMKPPAANLHDIVKENSNVGATTWHQDIVALLPEADGTNQLTVWAALTDATLENGCLASIPGSHREGPKPHCSYLSLASEPQVPDKVMAGRTSQPLPVKKGGIILFHKMNVHRALPNQSDNLRWSMDLRYHPTGQATGRPAFPGFIARSRTAPETELKDPQVWRDNWDQARARILTGAYKGKLFEATRYEDPTVC